MRDESRDILRLARRPDTLLLIVCAAWMLAGCGGSPSAPTAQPSAPAPPVVVEPPPPPVATPTPLPLGQASGGPTPCPSGSPLGPTCLGVTVACPAVEPGYAWLRVDRPARDERGTLLMTADGDGAFFVRSRAVSPLMAPMIATLVADGVTVVEVAWRPSLWGGPAARSLACRFATLARWVYENVHKGGRSRFYGAQGTGGGASQIAFGLAHYGMGEYLDLANLGGGPLSCPLCGAGQESREPLLPGAPGVSTRAPLVSYQATTVRVFVGERESADVVSEASAYFAAVTSAKSFTTVPGAGHTIEETQAGIAALLASVRAALR